MTRWASSITTGSQCCNEPRWIDARGGKSFGIIQSHMSRTSRYSRIAAAHVLMSGSPDTETFSEISFRTFGFIGLVSGSKMVSVEQRPLDLFTGLSTKLRMQQLK